MDDEMNQFQSPGGFVFGVQGWLWGEPRPKSITFFLDGTAKVCDQHGRPIKGAIVDSKEVKFAAAPPKFEDIPSARDHLATHKEVIAALTAEGVDWLKLYSAGWPQLPYAELVKLPELPPTPIEELSKIRNLGLRKDAIRARREADEAKVKELYSAEPE